MGGCGVSISNVRCRGSGVDGGVNPVDQYHDLFATCSPNAVCHRVAHCLDHAG